MDARHASDFIFYAMLCVALNRQQESYSTVSTINVVIVTIAFVTVIIVTWHHRPCVEQQVIEVSDRICQRDATHTIISQ